MVYIRVTSMTYACAPVRYHALHDTHANARRRSSVDAEARADSRSRTDDQAQAANAAPAADTNEQQQANVDADTQAARRARAKAQAQKADTNEQQRANVDADTQAARRARAKAQAQKANAQAAAETNEKQQATAYNWAEKNLLTNDCSDYLGKVESRGRTSNLGGALLYMDDSAYAVDVVGVPHTDIYGAVAHCLETFADEWRDIGNGDTNLCSFLFKKLQLYGNYKYRQMGVPATADLDSDFVLFLVQSYLDNNAGAAALRKESGNYSLKLDVEEVQAALGGLLAVNVVVPEQGKLQYSKVDKPDDGLLVREENAKLEGGHFMILLAREVVGVNVKWYACKMTPSNSFLTRVGDIMPYQLHDDFIAHVPFPDVQERQVLVNNVPVVTYESTDKSPRTFFRALYLAISLAVRSYGEGFQHTYAGVMLKGLFHRFQAVHRKEIASLTDVDFMRFVEASRGSFDVLSMRVSVFNKGGFSRYFNRQYDNDDNFEVNLFQNGKSDWRAIITGDLRGAASDISGVCKHQAVLSGVFSSVLQRLPMGLHLMGRIGRSGPQCISADISMSSSPGIIEHDGGMMTKCGLSAMSIVADPYFLPHSKPAAPFAFPSLKQRGATFWRTMVGRTIHRFDLAHLLKAATNLHEELKASNKPQSDAENKIPLVSAYYLGNGPMFWKITILKPFFAHDEAFQQINNAFDTVLDKRHVEPRKHLDAMQNLLYITGAVSMCRYVGIDKSVSFRVSSVQKQDALTKANYAAL
ncbi:unnamed protein product [Ectocarpus sp. 8 AP-2014]